jgi:hypothetical protein
VKTARARFPTHCCAIKGCQQQIARRHFVCSDHYALVPRWLQQRIAEQVNYGIAWKCHPTQEYIDLRSQAIKLVVEASREKYSRPTEQQLPLLPAT